MFVSVLVAALVLFSMAPKETEAMGGIMLFTPCSSHDPKECRMYKRAFMPWSMSRNNRPIMLPSRLHL
uniref:Secreted protein n=1 Tax=Steinernema glaseri TaxID=37863 RepID=A0A1I7Z915_9BILA